jgi:toxin YoeB
LIVAFSDDGWEDYLHWVDQDRAVLDKINQLIESCRRTPFGGVGKPEPLKNELKGWWSRRIAQEHRLIYRVSGKGRDQTLEIIQCRGHY